MNKEEIVMIAKLKAGVLAATLYTIPMHADDSMTLDQFDAGESTLEWRAVNDGVMGGLSKGAPVMNDQSQMVFSGSISFENNGGFSSIRSRGQTLDLTEYDGIEIRVKGDGRMYYLTARNPGSRRVAFWSPITPKADEWTTIRVPFPSFYATFFGRKLDSPELQRDAINSIGFMLYDKKEGAFQLEVDWIKAYKNQQTFLY